jgi:TonB family protein
MKTAATIEAFTCSLIRHAARSAPPDLAERLEEEWLADLAARRGAFARLRLAIGCCWATRVIASEHLAAGVAASAVAGERTIAALTPHGFSLLSRRSVIFMLIVGMHVVLIWAFATGLYTQVIRHAPTVIQGVWLPQPRKPDVTLPPPAVSGLPNHHAVVPDLLVPDFNVEKTILVMPVESFGSALGSSTPTANAVKRVQGGPGAGFPDADEYYPPSAVRLREEGVSAVRVCVNENGRLSAAPTLAQSSGIEVLDEGALKLAKAGSAHYRTTIEDGRPVSDCYSFRVRFELKR